MAKMWKVPRLDCSRDFASNARQVIPVRVAEVYSHVPSLAPPGDPVGLHDLRISIKRLRYSLEFFAICFDTAEVEALLAALAEMQELLGNIHDADLLIPELQRTVGEIGEEWAIKLRRATASAEGDGGGARSRAGAEPERAPRSPYEPGLLGLLSRMRAQRRGAYRSARRLWRRLEAEGLQERFERLLDPGTDAGEGA